MITFKQFISESFDWESLKFKHSNNDSSNRLDFSNDSGAVGYISWSEDDGEIEQLFVGRPYRRLGVATHMYEIACDWAKENNQIEPEHSSRHTKDGEAWAQSIGGHIPDIDDDIDGWTRA